MSYERNVIWSAVFAIKWRYDPRTCWTISTIVSWTWKIQVTPVEKFRWLPLSHLNFSTEVTWIFQVHETIVDNLDSPELTCSQLCDLVAQSVRALHWHRRGHGFQSRWVTWIFQVHETIAEIVQQVRGSYFHWIANTALHITFLSYKDIGTSWGFYVSYLLLRDFERSYLGQHGFEYHGRISKCFSAKTLRIEMHVWIIEDLNSLATSVNSQVAANCRRRDLVIRFHEFNRVSPSETWRSQIPQSCSGQTTRSTSF